MEYAKLIEQIKTKIDDVEFNEKDAEFKNDAKTFGIADTDLEAYLLRRWTVYFSKAMMTFGRGKKITAEGVLLSISSSDFGARRQYDKAVKTYTDDPEDAIAKGLTDKEGNPIAQNGINKGKLINLDKADSWQIEGAFKIEGSQTFVPGILSLGNNVKEEFLQNIPLCKLLSFDCNLNNKDEEDQTKWLKLSKNKLTKFNIKQELSFGDLQKLFDNFLKDSVMTLPQAKEAAIAINTARENGEPANYNKIYIIKGDMGSDGVNILEEGKSSDVLTLTENSNPEQLMKMISEEGYSPITATVWVAKNNTTIKRNISSDALDIFVVGTPSFFVKDDGTEYFSINARGVIVDEKYLIEQDAEPVTPEGKKDDVWK